MIIRRVEGTPEEVASGLSRLVAEHGHAVGSRARATLILEEVDSPAYDLISPAEFERLMSEARADAVSVGNVDDSREAIYTRMPGE